ncbi:alpha/beta hydrolase [Opitutia bacterium ISCC 51]|nr:alpha/beta hydrolase [Opitutae bacterium ISCC 51]QXD27288.1 alpha/beta hydrolase [Opitutae bacterium ISCC 52]
MKFVIPIIISLFLGGLGLVAEEAPFAVHKGLVYSEVSGGITLDLFVPETASEPVPCILVIQGGGFNAQDGQKFRPFAEYLAEQGLAAALIAYRGRPNHQYKDTVADTKAAVRFVRKIAEQYSIDPERIGAMGRSAGGTLAGLLAVTGGMESFEGEGGHPDYSSRIQAAVAYAGVFDFVSRFTDEKQIALQPNVETKVISNGKWVGPSFSPDGKDWIHASVITHVDKEDPPILLIHCEDDATVPWLQSELLFEAMKEVGADVSQIYYKEGGHGFKGRGEQSMASMVEFFKETL